MKSRKKLLFIITILSFGLKVSLNEDDSKWENRECQSLFMGQYKCAEPLINDITQSALNCTNKGTVKIPCYPANNVICEKKKFDGKTIGFYKETSCRFVTNYYYQTAVLLSIFLGIFGIDRIYLGYMAIGVIKACTFGFMLVGYLIDILLIITQSLGPSDGSNYIVDYYGQILIPSKLYNNNTFNLTLKL